MKACIFLDIDGTLLDHEIGIQESSRIAIAQAQANGHRVCLATGRPKPEVDDEIQAIPFDGCIYSCGAMVESHGKVLFYKPFSQELARQYMAAVRMHPLQEVKETDTLQIMKIATFINEDSLLQEFDRQLPAQLKHIHHGFHEGCTNGEIYHHTITKATGIDCLLSHFEIPLEASIAIGDSLNDAEMIRHSNLGVAMGNACEELKLISDMITTTSKEDGIYNCMKKLKLI